MTTEQQLPNSDPDLILAKQIGEALESGFNFSDIEDAMVGLLLEHKENELSSYELPSSLSQSLWSEIEGKTIKEPAKVTPLFARPSSLAWASAAVVLIAAFIGFYWITLQPQIELIAESGNQIEVVTLDDGTEVTMRPNSSLSQITNTENTRSYILDGEAFFDVVTNPEIPFSVDGTYGTVTVLGTRFNLSTWGDKAIVYLEEGRVAFSSNSSDEEIVLNPGQSSQVSEGSIELITQADSEQYTDWISNTIVFNRNTPEEVINEINQHFGVTINIDQLQNRSSIDGSLGLESLNQTLNDLGLVLGGTFRQISETEFEFISME